MENGFKVIGISVRTTNQDNQNANDIGLLWGHFINNDIFSKIPNKNSNDILSIYTDYKSNYTEEYTTILGVTVSTLDDIPDGLIGREFQGDNFTKFTAKGQMPMAVVDTWVNIWQNDDKLNRKYNYDFEVYGEKSQNGENSEVEIYISTNK